MQEDISSLDLEPSDRTAQTISLIKGLMDVELPHLNINDYVSYDEDSNTSINDYQFDRDLNSGLKSIESVIDDSKNFLLTDVVENLSENLAKFNESLENKDNKVIFPHSKWGIRKYADNYSDNILANVKYQILNIKLNDNYNLQETLDFYEPAVRFSLKKYMDIYWLKQDLINEMDEFKFLKNLIKNNEKELDIPDYLKKEGDLLDIYYELSKSYSLKSPVMLNALRKDPFMEGLAKHYLTNDDWEENNFRYIFNNYLEFYLKSNNIFQFPIFKDVVENWNEFKKSPGFTESKDKITKATLNVLVAYLKEMEQTTVFVTKLNFEKLFSQTIHSLEKMYTGRDLNMNVIASSPYLEYALMKFEAIENENTIKNPKTKSVKF